MNRFSIISIFISTILFGSCIHIPKQKYGPAEGMWRGTFVLEDNRQLIVTKGKDKVVTRDVFPESQKKVIPCNFKIVYQNDSTFYFEFINGEEKLRFDRVISGHDYETATDTFCIYLDPYDAVIRGVWEQNKLAGDFIVLDKKKYSIPFTASYGQTHRFVKIPLNSSVDIQGNWEVVFDKDSADRYYAIGEFVQFGTDVLGTFRTESGDYRYLQGQLDGHSLKLSTFDGAHVFMFEAEVHNDQMKGTFYSGNHYKASFEASKSNTASLKKSTEINKVISTNPVEFVLTNTDGALVSLNDDKYKGKCKIIQIMGTWCPNCRDESEFLLSALEKSKIQDVEIIAIGFERYTDEFKAIERLKSYKNKMNIPYEILRGGIASKDSASVLFPQIDKIKAFPTLIFLNKSNQIKAVHTGFDGPATSAYKAFEQEFEVILERLKQD